MKKHSLLLALAFAGLLSVGATAQTFVGSDNFDSGLNTANWDYAFRIAGSGTSNGSLSFTNSRLDFSKSAGAGSQFRGWDSDDIVANGAVVSASYTSSWVMTLTTTNTLTGLASGEYATLGLQVESDTGQYSALMLNATNPGAGTLNFIRTEGSGFTPVNTSVVDNTDVALRLTWDASAKTLAAAYSLDGSSFTTVGTFLPATQWTSPATTATGFNFEVFGNSNMAAAISTGSVYADNFSVSAIPEPSTYAALAGLGALGLVFWRKRRTIAPAA